MKLEDLALCTREEFEQQLNKMCPDSKCKNPGDDLDGMNRGALKEALERFKAGDDRSEIIDDTFDAMELP